MSVRIIVLAVALGAGVLGCGVAGPEAVPADCQFPDGVRLSYAGDTTLGEVGLAAPGARAAEPACPEKPSGTMVAKSAGGVLWHQAGSLYVCTAYYGDPPVSKKLGPWTKGSKVSFDGSTAVWTARTVVDEGLRIIATGEWNGSATSATLGCALHGMLIDQ